jgi:hypothetical protein
MNIGIDFEAIFMIEPWNLNLTCGKLIFGIEFSLTLELPIASHS